ncbi:WhiB family transcriptional regulator [Streptomyces lincolnensis]|uniref:WhiB family transcriptional regulator n=1 Tax=Streptomyces lincolnensis TaxID=1915 RepID=UPI001E433CD3|nr:WhiB family transcriptional regulator [Streptomyces lincolnensis]MCD7440287.1 WhiB family transcriptional regulator [Streptomyces lincolnensis]
MDREWELKALCRSEDPELWFSKRTWRRAKEICLEECPVREECLEAILARESHTAASLRVGIVAGLTGAQRAKVAASRRPTAPAANEPEAEKPKGGRPLAPCGTKAAYDRHVRKKEPIDSACREANTRCAASWRHTGSTKVPAAR